VAKAATAGAGQERRASFTNSRFGSPLVLSRVHWVRPEMVVEVSYLSWTEDGLLRQVVYLGEREDKPAAEVQRGLPRLAPVGGDDALFQ
jgi:ATP-dependent DNA ligase